MGKTTVSRRGIRGGKRMDVNQWKDMLGQQETTTSLGVVRKFPGETSHYEISTENGSREILVDVELIPSSVRVLCRLGFGNQGVYSIPKVDSEVAVLLPYDAKSSLIKDPLDFEPIIVAVLDTNAPGELSDDSTVVVFADTVLIGDSSAQAVPTKADIDTLINVFNAHTHVAPPGGGTTAPPVAQQLPPTYTTKTKLT